ncbi:MAG: class IV adenylate cyclase [Bacteroidota bacterium]
MSIKIIEIKAKARNVDKVRAVLQEKQADFRGLDHQIDTYFKVPNGRLKLREGNIENTLIHYHRPNQAGPKKSEVSLYRTQPDITLKGVLTAALGILTVVDKQRAIYFIENVKFHIDEVKQLGHFIEIEAIDETGELKEELLLEQCKYYMSLFGVIENDLLENSYSDMMIARG